MSVVISAADSSGTPTAAYCGACRAQWRRPPGDDDADTLPGFAVDHLEHLAAATAGRVTAARLCQLVAEGDTPRGAPTRRGRHPRATGGAPRRRGGDSRRARYRRRRRGGRGNRARPVRAASAREPLTAAGVVDLATAAVDLAGRYLYLEDGTDPDDRAAIAAMFAEGVAYESTDPDYEEET